MDHVYEVTVLVFIMILLAESDKNAFEELLESIVRVFSSIDYLSDQVISEMVLANVSSVAIIQKFQRLQENLSAFLYH